MRVVAGIIAFLLSSWLLPGAASAHPMLDRAVAAYEQADFALALRTFDTAERNADLTVDELLTLFEMRALVHRAVGDDASMHADLRRLVAVRESYELGRLAPPAVRAAFDEVRETQRLEGRVELELQRQEADGKVNVVARLLRVPDELVDHVTLQCNVANGARTVSRTSRGTDTSVELPPPGVHHGCAATARTRQGGVLFSGELEGLPPLLGRSGTVGMPEYQSRDSARAGKKKWPWIVAAAAVVVAGGVTAGVVISQRSKGSSASEVGGVTVNW